LRLQQASEGRELVAAVEDVEDDGEHVEARAKDSIALPPGKERGPIQGIVDGRQDPMDVHQGPEGELADLQVGENTDEPQRQLVLVGGRPIRVPLERDGPRTSPRCARSRSRT
jgi:hypothetical protein